VEGFFLHANAPFWPTCHRVAVCNVLAGVLGISAIVSQSDVVRHLLEHAPRGALGPMTNRSLEDLGLVIDPQTMQPRCVNVSSQMQSCTHRCACPDAFARCAAAWSAWMAACPRWTRSAPWRRAACRRWAC
jgi:hypothetical protein